MRETSDLLAGRAVLVIGGSSGIGAEVARRAAAAGAHLILTGRDDAKLAAAARRIGATRAEAFDAHDEHALARFFDRVEDADHVVSMVGDSTSGGFLETTPDTMRHVLASKFATNWAIARLAAGRIRDGGSMTFTAGTGGRPHDTSATTVANLGIQAMVQGLAVEAAPAVRVNAVAPTFMDTPFWRGLSREQFDEIRAGFVPRVPLGRLGTVEEVADAYVFLMTATFVTGQVLAVDGGVSLTR
jgi:NAD(P)-dependent dehydrogenase (short-subunit alcohol dehydrogenase family)